MNQTHLFDVAHLSWQGGVVLGLLFLGVFLSRFIPSIPRDLTLVTAALLTPLFGIVSSTQLYEAGVNQVVLTVLGLWIMGKAVQERGWKMYIALLLFFGALIASFFGTAIGTAFFLAASLLLLVRPFPLKKTFRDQFPLPLFLEIFSAYIFFFAAQESGLIAWAVSSVQGWSPFILLCLFFCSLYFLRAPRFLLLFFGLKIIHTA
ncbi:MAG: hypothetical protein WA678_06765 [Rhabdochlamydiaceae bacterium]|jgi:hypothetical protein